MKQTVASDHGTHSQDKPIVLVADDSRVMRVALTRILKEQYTVLEAEHGEDAWTKLSAEPGVQMVFSDLSMPQLDGFGLLGRIRGSEQARIREVPFIVITGNEDDQTVREKAMAGGATDFILKPFQSVEIKARAKAHVDHLRKLGAVSEALEQKTVEDDATGLVNERYFRQRAEETLALAARQQMPVAVLQVQLDRYQALRHEQGDEQARAALAAVAGVLRARTRTEDLVAHFQDGLFALLSVAADQVGAAQLAGRVAEAVSGLGLRGADASVAMTVSTGIAVSAPGKNTTVEELLGRAERLLASALRKGGNTVVAEDYVQVQSQAATSERSDGTGTAELAALRERLRSNEQQLHAERAKAGEQQQELEQLRGSLVSIRDEADSLRAAAEQAQQSRSTAEQESERLRAEVERLHAESENLRFGASSSESIQAELQHTIDSLRAQLEEAVADLDAHRQRLDSELANRHAVESELAKLKLQEVARREAEQKAAEQSTESARQGLLQRFRSLMGVGRRAS